MAEPEAKKGGKQSGELLTLSEVSKRTGISMPTLQRYKKLYQSRIPSEGEGRRQRYPVEALEVFEEIKAENIKKRGRPPKAESEKKSSGRGRKAGKAGKAGGKAKKGRKTGSKRKTSAKKAESGSSDNLLTLTQISDTTKISYPTLVRYMKLYGDQVPHEGTGRRRRYHPEAVDVFRRLRSESSRGRRKGSGASGTGGRKKKSSGRGQSAGGSQGTGLGRRVQSLEKSHAKLEKQIKALIKQLQKPLRVTIQRT